MGLEEKYFYQGKIQTIIISAYNPLRKYTSLSPSAQVRHPIKLPLIFPVSALPRGSGELGLTPWCWTQKLE
ncbi:hypothetical protein [Virgibacillus sp. YIM 98842]|jgi:hypothetical protein|uniref:hypothetical protein n=1 Tax=Virgibacillus sp. YIM 98842 TaxID=2663533 RepID=UPI0013DC07FC|nr:hypothetical protein [Virgibacillus sp. YIM 98842]